MHNGNLLYSNRLYEQNMRWRWWSRWTLCMVILFLSIYTMYQWHTLRSLRYERMHTMTSDSTHPVSHMTQHETTLKEYTEKITKRAELFHRQLDLLHAITHALRPQERLEHIGMTKQGIDITLLLQSVNRIASFLKKEPAVGYGPLRVTSWEQKEPSMVLVRLHADRNASKKA